MSYREDPAERHAEELRRVNEDQPLVCPECMGDIEEIRLRVGLLGNRMRCQDCGHEFDEAQAVRQEVI